MAGKRNTQEYSKQINEVLNYILEHLKDDLSLEKLAGIANYSPFHFQKIFKQVVGESPKQYIMRAKLESAEHFINIHKTKSITEISIDCGFSSPSAFARAFKKYFGVSAIESRNMPLEDKMKFFKSDSYFREFLKFQDAKKINPDDRSPIQIVVKKIDSIHGFFTNTSLESEDKIRNAFRKSIQVSETNDFFDSANSMFIGILYPHRDLYRALVTFNPVLEVSKKINTTEIKSGRYATFKLRGTVKMTFEAMRLFNDHWLPNSGYRIADICGFEILSGNPVDSPYHEIERELYIPIEPI
jgi:AraC family transcriptional regulator